MKKIIKAGSKLAETSFDFETESFIVPTIWEIKGGGGRSITVHFTAEGHTEKELRGLGWGCVDDYDACGDTESEATVRYFKTHTIESVLSGNNPSVSVSGIRVDDCASVTADLNVRRNLRIRDELYLDLGLFDLVYEVIVWNDDRLPIERYTIECFGEGDVAITEYRNNGKSVAKWPVKDEIRVVVPHYD